MDLKNFISESLCQIVEGIKFAQKRITGSESCQPDVYQDVYFDIALTVISAGEEQSSTSRLLVMGLSHLGSASFEQMLSLVSRVKFTVPLSYVQNVKESFSPYLHLGVH